MKAELTWRWSRWRSCGLCSRSFSCQRDKKYISEHHSLIDPLLRLESYEASCRLRLLVHHRCGHSICLDVCTQSLCTIHSPQHYLVHLCTDNMIISGVLRIVFNNSQSTDRMRYRSVLTVCPVEKRKWWTICPFPSRAWVNVIASNPVGWGHANGWD